jgi:hypothetical protein
MKRAGKHKYLDPFAGPAWRWDLAGEIAGGKVLRQPVDAMTQAAVALRESLGMGEPGVVSSSPAVSSQLAEAYRIFQEDGIPRAKLEAYVLTGLSDAEVAARLGLRQKVVTVYTKVFFDVRESLKAGDWLMLRVVGLHHVVGFRDDQLRSFWAWCAVGGGPLVVDTLVSVFETARQSGDPACLSVYLQPGVPLGLQAFVTTAVLRACPQTNVAFLRFQESLQAAERAGDPESRAIKYDRLQAEMVRYAKAFLAGKPLPQPPRAKPRKPRVVRGKASGTQTKASLRKTSVKTKGSLQMV